MRIGLQSLDTSDIAPRDAAAAVVEPEQFGIEPQGRCDVGRVQSDLGKHNIVHIRISLRVHEM